MAQSIRLGAVAIVFCAPNIYNLHKCDLISWAYSALMSLEFDPVKRDKTVAERGLDFARAGEVFDGVHMTGQDSRTSYPEDRFITVGYLDQRLVVMVWTPRGEVRRVISMRKANDREKIFYSRYMDRP